MVKISQMMVMTDFHHHPIMMVSIIGIIYELSYIFHRPLCTVIYYFERVNKVLK